MKIIAQITDGGGYAEKGPVKTEEGNFRDFLSGRALKAMEKVEEEARKRREESCSKKSCVNLLRRLKHSLKRSDKKYRMNCNNLSLTSLTKETLQRRPPRPLPDQGTQTRAPSFGDPPGACAEKALRPQIPAETC